MKKVFALLLIVTVVAVGMFVKKRADIASASADVRAAIDETAKMYGLLIEDHVLPHEDTFSIDQRAAVSRMEDIQMTLAKDLPLEERVTALNNLQKAIRGLTDLTSPDHAFASTDSYRILVREMGERGEMRTTLNGYNEAARLLNSLMESQIGSLTASLAKAAVPLLPYLRFDGETETVPVISI